MALATKGSARTLATMAPLGGALAPGARAAAAGLAAGAPPPPPLLLPRAARVRHARAAASATPAAAAAAAAPAEPETFTYQAEVDRLMDMIVNSLYSNREVFLRELVSNASDALDKVRLLALTDPSQYSTGDALEVRVRADKGAGTITIEDTGVGMTRDELLSSLGTIARSGTAKFAEAMKEAKGDAALIGQFGVGFYSAFLVADRVEVTTKSNADDRAWRWSAAAGSHQYSVAPADDAGLARGTRVVLHLKPDAAELADDARLGQLIKQYSEFISFPIKLWATKQEPVQVVDEAATKAAQEAADAKAKEEGGEPPAVDQVMKTEWVPKQDWAVQNDNKPLWVRPARDVAPEEYASFFKATFREFVDPLAHAHFKAEGTIEFSALLFVPGMAPFDAAEQLSRGKSRAVRLYVKRVFISDEFDDDLMPRWLSFVRGVVDSADLPLNVSREILQESRVVRAIRKQLVKRSLEMLEEVAARDGGKDYATFWDAFGRNIKLGVIEDAANKEPLSKLLRFASSASGEGLTSLAEYVGRMKPDQKAIYYLAADSRAAAEASPYVEALAKRGLEVLYLTEPIDEVAAGNLAEFDGKPLADVSREDLALGESEDDKKALEGAAARLKPLTDFMKKVLGERVEKVVVTGRLTDSPAVVVASKFGWSASMEKVMRAQAMGDARAAEYMRGKRVLEINPDHPIVAALADKVALESGEVRGQVELLFDAASLAGGFLVENPRDFASRVYAMMGGGDAK